MNNNTLCLRSSSPGNFCNPASKTELQQRLRLWKQRLHRWHINWRTRRQLVQLVQLDSYQLKDFGVSLGEAMEEANKPFWKD